MAKEQAKSEPPALIDYSEGPVNSKPGKHCDPESTADVRAYWEECLRKKRIGTLPWTVKDFTLWRRLKIQYGTESLMYMIEHWMNSSLHPAKFVLFYTQAYSIYVHTKERDYSDYE